MKIELFDSQKHERAHFSCEEESLTWYLKKQASQDIKKKLATCFVLISEESNDIKGFYTLSSESIPRQEVPPKFQKSIPSSYSVPVILLGRLARDISMKGTPAGEVLLIDALKRSLHISNSIGALAVVVDPINSFASQFYTKYGFIQLPDSGRMFIPMKTLQSLP